jgi:hypothetical protein
MASVMNLGIQCVHFHVGVKVGQTIDGSCPKAAKRLRASKLKK